jgi:glycosyltransferase involved in cell wall biosynthesis
MTPRLTILIATVPERHEQLSALLDVLGPQAAPFKGEVEIILDQRPKANQPEGVSIGQKRNDLLQRANGDYIVYFDDDDMPEAFYLRDIMEALEKDPDCVGQVIKMTINGMPSDLCIHSLRYPTWSIRPLPSDNFGNAWQRNVTHRNPVRRSIALQVGFPDQTFGEDKVYSDRVTQLCESEVFIERPAFTYQYSTAERHNAKYGIA